MTEEIHPDQFINLKGLIKYWEKKKNLIKNKFITTLKQEKRTITIHLLLNKILALMKTKNRGKNSKIKLMEIVF